MQNYIDIDNIKNLDCLNSKISFILGIVLFLIINVLLVFILQIKFNIYYDIKGIVTKDNNSIMLKINPNDLKKITKNKKMSYQKKEYNYVVEKISDIKLDEYFFEQYYEINIKSNIPKIIKNDILDIRILERKTNVFKIIKDFIIEGG